MVEAVTLGSPDAYGSDFKEKCRNEKNARNTRI